MAPPSQAMENGHVPMPVSYAGGFVALSYIISAMGSVTCLEMLHRRTSRSGLFNWYLLLTSSLCMGGIGIWSMHFIGNRAIYLGNGADSDQISYNIPFTILSLILPILVLCAAFYAISFEERPAMARLAAGGVLTGGAICGMHYIGQLGISNYTCSYAVGNIIGAAMIAVFSAMLALTVFFRWKAAWADSWWRRLICAALLAGAVSGMHWTAAVGTSYRRIPSAKTGAQLSRTQTVIICSALSFASCVILSICAVVAGGNRRRSTTRARQLVLSCVLFDPAGRIMVTPQAMLPTRKVVDRYIGRYMKDDDFSRTHPAFLWAFRASRNWSLVKDIIPFMKRTLQNDEEEINRLMHHRGAAENNNNSSTGFRFDTLFKQFFCVSAQDLADELRQPLSGLGELYPEVVSTSTQISRFQMRSSSTVKSSRPRLGKGQLMFTVRQLSGQEEVARFMANGFRFAPIERIASTLASRIHVPVAELAKYLHEMHEYCRLPKGYPSGVHVVTFAMRPTIHEHFEVLATLNNPIALPSSSLPVKLLQQADLDLISQMNDFTITTCLKHLTAFINDSSSSTESLQKSSDSTFADHLYRAILELSATLPKNIASAVRFSGRPLSAPSRGELLTSPDPEPCTLLCFRVVSALDTQIPEPGVHHFVPLRLFRVQEQVNDGFVERDRFLRELNAEFASYSAQSMADRASVPSSSLRMDKSHWGRGRRRFSLTSFALTHHRREHRREQEQSREGRSLSQESLVRQASQKKASPNEIFINREVRIQVSQLDDTSSTVVSSSKGADVRGRKRMEATCYVDELYGLCLGSGVRMAPGYV